MARDRSRVLATLVAYLLLVIVSTFVMDWFVMSGGGMLGGAIAIDLRSVTICSDADPCVSVSFSGVPNKGVFPIVAFVAFWGTTLIALLVTFQAGSRIISGVANPSLGKIATFGSLAMAGLAGAAGFVFAPELDPAEAELVGLTVDRTSAPLLLILAHILGIIAVHWAGAHETLETEPEYKPIQPLTPALPIARVVPQTGDIKPIGKTPERKVTEAVPEVATAERPATSPKPTTPEELRKKLHYATLAAEVTRAGIDARREDGALLLVMWRDVVGVVARRLPPELEGVTFVDIVSTAGATLRILPWTLLTGELAPRTGDDRARALVAFILASCPTVKLDARTQAFCDNAEAAQLPDLAKLAAHDTRLA